MVNNGLVIYGDEPQQGKLLLTELTQKVFCFAKDSQKWRCSIGGMNDEVVMADGVVMTDDGQVMTDGAMMFNNGEACESVDDQRSDNEKWSVDDQ